MRRGGAFAAVVFIFVVIAVMWRRNDEGADQQQLDAGQAGTLLSTRTDALSGAVTESVSSHRGRSTQIPSGTAVSRWDTYPAGFQDCRQQAGHLDCGSCRIDTDCKLTEACILDPTTRRWACAPSQCTSDADCSAAESCRAAGDPNFGNNDVRRCVAGVQQRDDECSVLPSAFPNVNCRLGLICVEGSCQDRCTQSEAAVCPEGVCLDTANGPGCLVTCKTRGCPDAYECLEVEGDSLCVAKGSCIADGCGDGQTCAGQGDGKRWSYTCVTPCDPRRDTCAEGWFCGTTFGADTCVQRCDPQMLDSCPNGRICGSSADEPDRWGCIVEP